MVKCDICDRDVLLPFVHYSPRKDILSPKNPKAECPMCHQKTFNVDEVLFLVRMLTKYVNINNQFFCK